MGLVTRCVPRWTLIRGDERKARPMLPGRVMLSYNSQFEKVKLHAANVVLDSCLMLENLWKK